MVCSQQDDDFHRETIRAEHKWISTTAGVIVEQKSFSLPLREIALEPGSRLATSSLAVQEVISNARVRRYSCPSSGGCQVNPRSHSLQCGNWVALTLRVLKSHLPIRLALIEPPTTNMATAAAIVATPNNF